MKTYLLPSHQLENGDTVIYSVHLFAKKLCLYKENVTVAGIEPCSVLPLPKVDRNKCLSGGACLFLVIVTDGV